MKNITIILLIFILFSCNNFKEIKKNEKSCASKFFNEAILVSREDSVINVKDFKNNEVYQFVSNTSNCLQPILDNNNILYAPITDKVFQCIDIKTKKVKWIFKPPELINNFKIFDDYLVLSIRDYGLVILDANTGKLNYELKEYSTDCHKMLVNDFFIGNNKLYVSDFRCSNLVCFDITSGREIWTYKSPIIGATQILLKNEYVFCGITGNPLKSEGIIVLLDKDSGKIKFIKNETFDLVTKPLIYKNKIIYYSYESKINLFDIDKLEIKNLISFNTLEGICDGQIYLLDDCIYFTNCHFELNKYNLKSNKSYKLGKSPKNLTSIYKINNEVKFIY